MGQENKKSRFGNQIAALTVVLKGRVIKKTWGGWKNDTLHTVAGSTRLQVGEGLFARSAPDKGRRVPVPSISALMPL
jgi:hypothetical protein